ncbi:MAG TPA: ATP-binding protein [Chloroflexia bacterium]|nr:ATP-binding protein [Chloroflexia bacterium]
MSKCLLIIVSGPPCTGKTTLGKRLADDLRLPFFNKDGIKEILFDTLGWKDRDWSRKLGIATYELLYHSVEAMVRAGKPLVVESNFVNGPATTRFLEMKARHGAETLQIQCITDGEVLFSRFKERAEAGERHPGHVDTSNYEEMRDILLKGRHDPLDIGGAVIEVDTTDFTAIQYSKLLDAVQAWLKSN